MSELSESFNIGEARKKLFSHLDAVLGFTGDKMDRVTVAEATKLACGRLRVSAVEAYGRLLADADLEMLKKDVDELKRLVKPNE